MTSGLTDSAPLANRCQCTRQTARSWFRENMLMVVTFLAVILGIAIGFGVRPLNPSYDVILWIGIWGELFLRMLKMIILPLIMCCLVVGVASLDGTASGKMGGVTLTYIFLTNLLSVILGVILAALIKPGAGFAEALPEGFVLEDTSYTDVFADLFRNMVPENIVQSCLQTAYTDIRIEVVERPKNSSMGNDTEEAIKVIRKVMYRDGMNIMGVVTFSLALGLATAAAGDAGKPLYRVFESLNDVIFKIMRAIIWYSPIGILSLIASAILKVDDLEDAMQAVGLLIGTVAVGCFIHQIIFLPIILGVICRRNPFSYFWGMMDAYLAGIAPPSSAVAMPYLLQSCPNKLGVDKRVTQFVVPICVTINRDGSALFIAVCGVFIAQSYSISLSIGDLIILALLVSILVAAAAVVPSSSIVVLIMVSAAVGIPVHERVGLLLAVDWINDRIRTGTNVVSHGYACAIVHRLSRSFIEPQVAHEYVNPEKAASEVDGESGVNHRDPSGKDTNSPLVCVVNSTGGNSDIRFTDRL